MKTKTGIFVLILASFFLSAVSNSEAAQPPKNIIIISWDGVQRDHLTELIKDNKLPNLERLISEGAIVPLEITTHQTDTKAGHTQMLTGYKPEDTNVYNNQKYGPIPVGLSIFERLENYYGADNIVTLMLTGKNHHIGSMPAGVCAPNKKQKLTGKAKKKNGKCLAEPWFNVRKHIDVWDGDTQRDAVEVGPRSLNYIRLFSDRHFFFFLHFSDPDHKGHQSGENSLEYSDAIITCDAWLGKIRDQIGASGLSDRTLIYVTADHGFDEGMKSHFKAPHIWLAANDTGLTAESGDQMDIVPTLLKRLGVPVDKFNPPLPGKPLF